LIITGFIGFDLAIGQSIGTNENSQVCKNHQVEKIIPGPGDLLYSMHYERLRELLFRPRPVLLFLPPGELAGGTFAPSFLASDKPIAIACFGLETFLPLFPLRSSPRFISCIFSSTSSWDFFEYLAIK